MDLKTFNPNGVGVDNGAYYGLPFTPEEARLLEEFIAEQFEPAEKPDGTPAMTRRYDRPVRWAFIAWEPPLR